PERLPPPFSYFHTCCLYLVIREPIPKAGGTMQSICDAVVLHQEAGREASARKLCAESYY
ncbi:MAG: hypothetical protein U0223_19155, partial [Nitrospira sp.]